MARSRPLRTFVIGLWAVSVVALALAVYAYFWVFDIHFPPMGRRNVFAAHGETHWSSPTRAAFLTVLAAVAGFLIVASGSSLLKSAQRTRRDLTTFTLTTVLFIAAAVYLSFTAVSAVS